eukprot:1293457-Pleurochrysis_carterae.AAC.2
MPRRFSVTSAENNQFTIEPVDIRVLKRTSHAPDISLHLPDIPLVVVKHLFIKTSRIVNA